MIFFSTQLLDEVPHALDARSRRRYRSRNQVTSPSLRGRWKSRVETFRIILISSLRKGVAAARQIAIPALIVQGLMLSLALGYFYVPAVRGVLEQAVDIKQQIGPPFGFLTMGIIAVFAETLRRQFASNQPRNPFWINAGYGFLVFGLLGVATDSFYLLQKSMWGGLPEAVQVPAKVLTDQFIYTVFFANPYQTLLYVWKDCSFRPDRFLQRIRPFRIFYVREMLAVLITNWAFWIPTTAIIYSLPLDLQFVISRLAITIWILLLTTLTRREES